MPVLTGVDVIGIQSFVFGSSRLRDVVGASWLVDWATAMHVGGLSSEGETGALRELGLISEQVLLAAGGNAVLRFESLDVAKEFASRYSRLLFEDAPGVDVVIAHREYQPGELAKALRALQVDLARSKLERRPQVPLLGISVTASCANTGLPAVEVDPRDHTRLLSRQAVRTGDSELRDKSTARWRTLLPEAGGLDLSQFEFPNELDDLGHSSGERSLLGVVHIDGNGIGQRIQQWLTDHADEETADDVVEGQYCEWSQALCGLGDAALKAVLQRICEAIEGHDESNGGGGYRVANRRAELASRSATEEDDEDEDRSTQRELSFRLHAVTDKARKQHGWKHDWWLPIRPILLGGDDLTFLCDGRIALDLAATALRAMEDAAKSVPYLGVDKEPITACAGVAIVPHHAPFVRSYELAEQLCQSAKRTARELKEKRKQDVSCIDWHIGLPKPGLSVDDVRQREYQASGQPSKSLTCRPYPLTSPDDGSLSWQWLDETLLDGRDSGLRASTMWNTRRNKVKELREVLRSPEPHKAVEDAIKRWKVLRDDLRLPAPVNKDGGFVDLSRTPLLDAIELLDMHLPLGFLSSHEGEVAR